MTSPRDPQDKEYTHIRGTQADLLDRFAVSELCKCWPVYRDASEWKNYRSMFAEDAYVWTTWSKRLHIDAFIAASKLGKSNGDFIMHRECGTLVDLNPSTGRAVGKMKATITQRFVEKKKQQQQKRPDHTSSHPEGFSSFLEQDIAKEEVEEVEEENGDLEYDVDCDCQFHFFCERRTAATTSANNDTSTATEQGKSDWVVKYVKLIYSKDKIVPVDGVRVPRFTPAELAPFPAGYKYLGAAQARLGHDMDLELPTPGDERRWLDLYVKMGQWLDGREDIDLVGCGDLVEGEGERADGKEENKKGQLNKGSKQHSAPPESSSSVRV